MGYGARIKEIRLAHDLRQGETAIFFGVSSSAIGSYEREERQPTFEFLQKYADYFGVSVDYILGRTDEKLTIDDYKKLDTIDLRKMLATSSVTLDGVELSPADKQRVLDIATVLCFDRLKE